MVPKEWHEASIVPIFKKGDRSLYRPQFEEWGLTVQPNYRGISLLCSVTKVLCFIIKRRLERSLHSTLDEAQYGF